MSNIYTVTTASGSQNFNANQLATALKRFQEGLSTLSPGGSKPAIKIGGEEFPLGTPVEVKLSDGQTANTTFQGLVISALAVGLSEVTTKADERLEKVSDKAIDKATKKQAFRAWALKMEATNADQRAAAAEKDAEVANKRAAAAEESNRRNEREVTILTAQVKTMNTDMDSISLENEKLKGSFKQSIDLATAAEARAAAAEAQVGAADTRTATAEVKLAAADKRAAAAEAQVGAAEERLVVHMNKVRDNATKGKAFGAWVSEIDATKAEEKLAAADKRAAAADQRTAAAEKHYSNLLALNVQSVSDSAVSFLQLSQSLGIEASETSRGALQVLGVVNSRAREASKNNPIQARFLKGLTRDKAKAEDTIARVEESLGRAEASLGRAEASLLLTNSESSRVIAWANSEDRGTTVEDRDTVGSQQLATAQGRIIAWFGELDLGASNTLSPSDRVAALGVRAAAAEAQVGAADTRTATAEVKLAAAEAKLVAAEKDAEAANKRAAVAEESFRLMESHLDSLYHEADGLSSDMGPLQISFNLANQRAAAAEAHAAAAEATIASVDQSLGKAEASLLLTNSESSRVIAWANSEDRGTTVEDRDTVGSQQLATAQGRIIAWFGELDLGASNTLSPSDRVAALGVRAAAAEEKLAAADQRAAAADKRAAAAEAQVGAANQGAAAAEARATAANQGAAVVLERAAHILGDTHAT